MPVNINLLPDEVIAKGVQPANVGTLFDSYFAGSDQAQKQQLQNLFSGGLPRTPQGDIDYNQIAEMLARAQGAAAVPALGGLRQGDIQQQVLKGLSTGGAGNIFEPPATPPPSIQRTLPPQRTSDEGGGEPGRAGLNTVQPNEKEGSATVQYDGGPPQPLSFASTETRGPFSQAPDTGPPIGRFTQVAQAAPQPPAQRAPPPPPPDQSPIPPGQPGFFSEDNARRYEAKAARGNYIATTLGVAQFPAGVAGPKQQAEQDANTAKQIREYLSKSMEEQQKSALQERRGTKEAVLKNRIEQLDKSFEKARTFAEGVPVTQELFDQLNKGVITGQWADSRLILAKVGQAFGIPDDRVTPTEVYRSAVGRQVATLVKNFGSGTSITDSDRKYAANMAGGSTELNEQSLRKILELADKVGRDNIKDHNQLVGRVDKAYPEAQVKSLYEVPTVQPLEGRTTQPPARPQGAIPPAPPPPQRQQGQVYQTPKGPYRWLGNGWGPP